MSRGRINQHMVFNSHLNTHLCRWCIIWYYKWHVITFIADEAEITVSSLCSTYYTTIFFLPNLHVEATFSHQVDVIWCLWACGKESMLPSAVLTRLLLLWNGIHQRLSRSFSFSSSKVKGLRESCDGEVFSLMKMLSCRLTLPLVSDG